jgi:serine/threonine protein kinase
VVNGTEPSSSEAGGSSFDSRPQSAPDRSTSRPAEAISDETVVTGLTGEPVARNEGAVGNSTPVTPSVNQPAESAAQATTRSVTDHDSDGAEVRIVEIPCSIGRPTTAAISEFRRVVRTLTDLAHPGVLPFLRVSPSPKQLTVVMNVPPGVSLESQLTDAMQPWLGVCELVQPVAETLADLHAAGVTHGGLRPDRIF